MGFALQRRGAIIRDSRRQRAWESSDGFAAGKGDVWMAQDCEVFVAVGEAARGEAEESAVGAGVAVGEEGDEASGGGGTEGGEVDGLEGGGDEELS